MPALLGLLRRLVVALLVGAGCAVAVAGTLRPDELGPAGWGAAAAGTALTFALLVLLARVWRRLVEPPGDEYGPHPYDREAFESHARKIARVARNRGDRLRVQRRIREALRRALEGQSLERCASWRAKAEAARAEWQERFHVPRPERLALERRFAADLAELQTVQYENAAESELERARSLKTERGREGAHARAKAVLEEGLADPAADPQRLTAFARQHELFEREPPAPTDGAPARWVPLGTPVDVAGYDVRGGLYLGPHLLAVHDEGAFDPACIDPHLAVAARPLRRPKGAPGPPSWAAFGPRARAGFLDWLAGGARDPNVAPAFPQLYLYGLERRLLVDAEREAQARREVGQLVAELERLERVFAGEQPQLAERARALADYAAVRYPAEQGVEAPAPARTTGEGLSGRLRVGLARLVAHARPIPYPWARAWLEAELEGRWRTPARRCPEELELLLRARYADRHGPGLIAAPGPQRITVEYRPASPSLGGRQRTAALDLPDPDGCAAARRALVTLADLCTAELAGLSRWKARARPGETPGLKVLAGLPAALLEQRDDSELEALRALLAELGEQRDGAERCYAPLERLTSLWPCKDPQRPTRADCAGYAQLLAGLGWGVEPDVRFDGERWRPGGQAVLFPLPLEAPHAPSRAYSGAVLVLRIAVAVSMADSQVGDGEETGLRDHLERTLDLDPAERARLEAHLAWLLLEPPGLSRLRRRAVHLPRENREQVADLLVRIACADGVVSPAEVRVLEKAYEVLELDPARVHADLHARDSRGGPRPRASQTGSGDEGIGLDPELLARKLRETAAVSALLDGIFEDEDEAPAAAFAQCSYAGLDPAHSALLEALAAREAWGRGELDELARELGLMPAGALDALNEAALDAAGEPVWEGEDPLEVDLAVARAMLED